MRTAEDTEEGSGAVRGEEQSGDDPEQADGVGLGMVETCVHGGRLLRLGTGPEVVPTFSSVGEP